MFATTLAAYFFLGVDFFFVVLAFPVEDFSCAAAAPAPSCDSLDFTLPEVLATPTFGAFRAAADKPAAEPDRGALVQYIALVAILSALSILPVHIAGR